MRYLHKTKNSIFQINNSSGQIGPIIIFLFLAAFFLLIGRFVALQSPLLVLGLVGGLIIALITLVNTDLALIILIFSMLLSPEIPIAQVPERAVVVRLDDILLMFMFFTWLAKMSINKELGFLRKTPLNLPIIAYILVYFLSTTLGIAAGKIHPLRSFFYLLKYVEYFMLYFMVTNVIRSRKQVRIFIIALLITCIITCAYANMTLGQFGRATAPFEGRGEANTLGGYLVLLFAMVSGLFLYSASATRRFWLVGLALFIFYTLLHTLSRGSYLAFMPMYLTLTILSKRKKGLLMAILILAIFLFPIILPGKVITRIKSTFIPGEIYEPFGERVAIDYSTASRFIGFQRVVGMWKSQPFLGYGATGIGFTDLQYALVLGETGLIGFLLFIWLMFTIFKYSLQSLRRTEDDWSRALILGFLAGFVGLLVHSFSANTFIIIRIMEPFWFLTAVVMVLPSIQPTKLG